MKQVFLLEIYTVYTCADKGWKTDVEDYSEGTSGGFKEIIFSITGEDVYGDMKLSRECTVCNVSLKQRLRVVCILQLLR